MATLRDIGEWGIIARLRARFPACGADVPVGIGDDCAVVQGAGDSVDDWLLTSDATLAARHFDAATPPAAIGTKAIGRVLSDIAAMGGSPRWVLLNLVAPATLPVADLDALASGLAQRAAEFGVAIVGGDTTEGPHLALHVFGVGTVARGQALRRAGARAGDVLFVTGCLGGSRLGKHLAFTPRVREGIWLRDWATAMIDVSDGLASDLRHLAVASGVGARLNLAALPISPAARNMADGRSPLEHALRDGEDFELLFTVAADRADAMQAAWNQSQRIPCTRIGVLTADQALVQVAASGQESALVPDGFEHFQAELDDAP